jgi:HEAT repeat protein
VKGTGIVILFALPFYGFTIIDALQLTYRAKTLGGARYVGKIPTPEAVVFSDTGCGGLCQELLLEDQVRYVEVASLGLATKTGINPPARLEKVAGQQQCQAAVERATPPEELDLHATGLISLDPPFQGAAAVDACIVFEIIADLTAPVVIHTWPKQGPHAPFYLGASDTEHHQIFRRGANLEIAELLAESESGWVKVVDFPPRIRFPDPSGEALSFSARMSYEAPPLSEMVARTLSLDINGRLDLPPAAAPLLIANLRQGGNTTRIAAAAALRDLIFGSATDQQGTPLDNAWLDPLVAALEDQDPSVRGAVAEAIGAYGPAAEAAIPALVDALGDDGAGVADQARAALSQIGVGAVQPLISSLNRADSVIRIGAVRALGTIGPNARAAGPALVKLLKRETGTLQAAAAWALGKLRWSEAVPLLLAAIEHSDHELRDSAKFALSHMGDAAVPGLIGKLDHDDLGVRLSVVEALGAIGPAARDAVPALHDAMGQKPDIKYLWAVEKIEGKR